MNEKFRRFAKYNLFLAEKPRFWMIFIRSNSIENFIFIKIRCCRFFGRCCGSWSRNTSFRIFQSQEHFRITSGWDFMVATGASRNTTPGRLAKRIYFLAIVQNFIIFPMRFSYFGWGTFPRFPHPKELLLCPIRKFFE